jgi:2-keto-3-deoxy-L-fuconate dehydrogenase
MFDFNSKNAVITGGGSGIGKAIAQLFAVRGAVVHILDLNRENADEVVTHILNTGGRAIAHPCNVADQAATAAVVKTIAGNSGRIHILVNSAGIAHIGKIETTTEADFDRIFTVNVKGVYNVMHEIVPHMKAMGGGVILNVASVASSLGIADRFAYSMSKGAVMSMTLSVAKDYIKDNIRCNCISPARIHTSFVDGFLKANYAGREDEMFEKLSKTQPIGRMGKPEEVASLAMFLCSDEASFITGSDYPLDGGFIRLNT